MSRTIRNVGRRSEANEPFTNLGSKAWLILMPTVGLGSYYLTRNAWRRIQAILQGEAGSVWDAPPIPEATEPPSFIFYGITAALIFSFFWIIIARLYVAAQASQRSKPPHE